MVPKRIRRHYKKLREHFRILLLGAVRSTIKHRVYTYTMACREAYQKMVMYKLEHGL